MTALLSIKWIFLFRRFSLPDTQRIGWGSEMQFQTRSIFHQVYRPLIGNLPIIIAPSRRGFMGTAAVGRPEDGTHIVMDANITTVVSTRFSC
jgi:hypothetical protein